MRSDVEDAWSPSLVASFAICTFGAVLLVQASAWMVIPLAALMPLTAIGILAWFCHDLLRRRPRHAISIVAAVAAAVGLVWQAPRIARGATTAAFHARLPRYEQQVEEARRRRNALGPLQVVVDYREGSPIAVANLFYYVVYDETDGAGPYEADFQPYAGSSTGKIAVPVPAGMHHLTRHYYDFAVSD